MAYVDFLSSVHKATNRDYVARVTEFPKAEAAKLAKQWGKDYWDGDRRTGYGGYSYDGRWRKVADALVAHYGIKPDLTTMAKILAGGLQGGAVPTDLFGRPVAASNELPKTTRRGLHVRRGIVRFGKAVRKEVGMKFGQLGNLDPTPLASDDLRDLGGGLRTGI